MTTLSTSSKELLTKICQDFCSLAVYRPATYQQRFSQAYIYNFFKGNYSYSLNNYNEIFRFIQTNKKEEWELAELPEPPKKKFRGDTQMIQSAEQSYTWGQNYKNHLGERPTVKVKVNNTWVEWDARLLELRMKIGNTKEENDEMIELEKKYLDRPSKNFNNNKLYDEIPQSRSVIKKGSRKYLGKAKSSAPVFQWYKHKSSNTECSYCGIVLTEHNRSRDHVHPIIQGGRHKDNLVWCCKQCNELKSGHTLEEWLILLKQKLPSLNGSNSVLTYHNRIIEAVTYMIKIKEDADLINDPENLKAASVQNHIYSAINKKKRKK